MLPIRSLAIAALALPFAFAACGGGDDDDDNGTVTPEGTHHQYVISKVTVFPPAPTSPASPGNGLDVGGPTSATLDGRIDNNLGKALQIISALPGLDVQATVNTAIAQGDLILLADFQSKDFMNSNAGFGIKFGSNPNPPACTDANDTTCGHHLMGGASFSVASNSPNDALLAGKLTNGIFDGGPGELSLLITIGNTTPILLPLVQARVKVTAASETGLKALMGGLVTATALRDNVGVALQASVAPVVDTGCTDKENPPDCGCSGLAMQLVTIADGADGTTPDCAISAQELLANRATGIYTTPDSCSMDTCTAADAVSVGLNIEAVAATF